MIIHTITYVYFKSSNSISAAFKVGHHLVESLAARARTFRCDDGASGLGIGCRKGVQLGIKLRFF